PMNPTRRQPQCLEPPAPTLVFATPRTLLLEVLVVPLPVCVGIRFSPSGGSHPLTLAYRVGVRVPVTLRVFPAAASSTLRMPVLVSPLILTNLVRVLLPEPAPTLESDLAVLGVPLPRMGVLLLPLPTAV